MVMGTNVAAGARRRLGRPDGVDGWSTPTARRLGLMWVGVTIPVVTGLAVVADTRTGYIVVLSLGAFGLYTIPALYVMWQAVRYAPPGYRRAHLVMYVALVATVARTTTMALWAVTGWSWYEPIAPVAAAAICAVHLVGLVMIVRRCSGQRALLVDLLEGLGAVIALVAPLVVLWLPAVADAEDPVVAQVAAVILITTLAAAYWVGTQRARRGLEGRWVIGVASILAAFVGAGAAGLNVAQGVTGFAAPLAPTMALTALAASAYLLIPLYAPTRMPEGLNRLAPQAQVRGGWGPIAVPVVGLTALVAATTAVADERPWAVPFTLAVFLAVTLLGAVRQVAALAETRRLYRQVETAAEDRHRLLTQLLARSVDDRRNVVTQLHEQAVAAYVSFSSLAAVPDGARPVVAQASELVRDDLWRQAEVWRDLAASLRPQAGDDRSGPGLVAALHAYVATLYGDAPAPALTMTVTDDLHLNWITESVILQIAQEALLNVHRHSHAGGVTVTLRAAAGGVELAVADDGVGFDPATTPAATGTATMNAAAHAVGGHVTVDSRPGDGTTVTAHLGRPSTAPPQRPALRLVPPPA